MADLSFLTKQKLKSVIRKAGNNSSSYVKNPDKDFMRNRKISFTDTLLFPISLQGQCLDQEMLRFYPCSTASPTSSAMLQARQKLKPSVWEYLFHSFTNASPCGGLFHGYRLLAVDGSRFIMPENPKEPLCWVKSPHKDKGKNILNLNALYHLGRGILEDVEFQCLHEIDEYAALVTMLGRLKSPDPFILTADRGYESFNTFAHIENKGGKYVIRGKQGETGILSGLDLPDLPEFDCDVSITICQKHTKNTKEDPRQYKRIRSDAKFDFFTESVSEYHMHFRVVKIKLSENLTEILFTNLPREEFSAEELKEIYHMRWEIETAFQQLKYALGAIAVHSKKAEFVMQELYAKIILFNFCKVIMSGIKVVQKEGWKYEYKLNVTMAVELCRKFWHSPKRTAPPDFEKILLRYLVPIRDNRNFPRTSVAKPAVHFNDRIS